MKLKPNNKLLICLRENNLRQADLTKMAEISCEGRLSRIIRGRIEPTQEEIRNLCRALRKSRVEIGFSEEKQGD